MGLDGLEVRLTMGLDGLEVRRTMSAMDFQSVAQYPLTMAMNQSCFKWAKTATGRFSSSNRRWLLGTSCPIITGPHCDSLVLNQQGNRPLGKRTLHLEPSCHLSSNRFELYNLLR